MNNIITLSGDPGSGKSTVRNNLKKRFEKQGKQVIIYSVGDIFRQLAEEKGLGVTEFNQFLEKNKTNVDEVLDTAVVKFGERVKKEKAENKIYIVDSRLAWHGIPQSLKVRLEVTDVIAGKRIFKDRSRGEEEQYKSEEAAIISTAERKNSERERYLDLYGIDLQDSEQYDLVIDTSYATVEDIADIVDRCMEAQNEQKQFSRYWKSPKQFMPIQSIVQTFNGNADSGMTLKEWKKRITENGVDIESPITTIKVGETFFVRDGHHRNFGAALAGKTLIPYEIKWRDDSDYNGMKAKDFISNSVLGD